MNDQPLIDLDTTLHHLKVVVDAKGADYVYDKEQCVYVDDEGPACIVGHVLDRLGMLNQTTVLENGEASDLAGFTNEALHALVQAQTAQDGNGWLNDSMRSTWGEALRAAIDSRYTYYPDDYAACDDEREN